MVDLVRPAVRRRFGETHLGGGALMVGQVMMVDDRLHLQNMWSVNVEKGRYLICFREEQNHLV